VIIVLFFDLIKGVVMKKQKSSISTLVFFLILSILMLAPAKGWASHGAAFYPSGNLKYVFGYSKVFDFLDEDDYWGLPYPQGRIYRILYQYSGSPNITEEYTYFDDEFGKISALTILTAYDYRPGSYVSTDELYYNEDFYAIFLFYYELFILSRKIWERTNITNFGG